MGQSCPNASCSGACNHCFLGFKNQQLHNLLDRSLSISVLEYLLEDRRPSIGKQHALSMASGVEEYVRSNWTIVDVNECPEQFGAVFRADNGVLMGTISIHPLSARPTSALLEELKDETGILPRFHTSFDLLRRPFWWQTTCCGYVNADDLDEVSGVERDDRPQRRVRILWFRFEWPLKKVRAGLCDGRTSTRRPRRAAPGHSPTPRIDWLERWPVFRCPIEESKPANSQVSQESCS